MVQRERFELDPATSILKMYRKAPDLPSIEASPGTIHLFSATHKDHLRTPSTVQWALTSTQNIKLISLSRSPKYITRHGDQVFNLCGFHHYLCIILSAYSNTNIEVLP